MLITLHSQNRSTSSTDVDTASNFTNVFNENIVLPRDCKIGVVSLSVNVNGDIVVDGTNNTFEVELASQSFTCTIASGTYKIQEQTTGTDPSTITFPFIEAVQTALTNGITLAGFSTMYPPSDNLVRGIKQDNGVGVQIDLSPTHDDVIATTTLSDTTLKATGIDTPLSNYGGEVRVNTFGTAGAQAGFGKPSVDTEFSVFDANGSAYKGTGSAISRYGQAKFRLGTTQGVEMFVGFFTKSFGVSNPPKKFRGFHIKTDNSILVKETDEAGTDLFTPFTAGISNDGSGDIVLALTMDATTEPRKRIPKYFISTDNEATPLRPLSMTAVADKRKTYSSSVSIFVATQFITGLQSRPALASLTSTSGEWTISTPGSGLSIGVSTMASTTSANGVITGGSINISAVGGSGEATAFNMSGATLPDRSSAGDFTTGDTITLTNGVVITKSATALTTDRLIPIVKTMSANVVHNPTRNPLLPNLDPNIIFNQRLADIFDVPRKNRGTQHDGTLHIKSRSPLNADRHQPEIYISSPTLPINSRTNKISHNTLSRVPVGLSDNQGSQTGFHFHEVFNVIYHRLFNSQEQTLSQIQVRLTDREGGDISSLLHPSTLTLHIDAR